MSRTDRVTAFRWALALAIALGAHGALAFGSDTRAPRRAPPVVTELELAPPASSPEPLPERPAPEQRVEGARERSPAARPSSDTKPASAARAGNVLTARADAPAPSDSEPVDFVTDPNGASYSGGVVARGGSGDHGASGSAARGAGARAAPASPTRPSVKGDVAPPVDLVRKASLRSGTDCAGYYPRQADSDSALVTLVASVGADGSVTRLVVSGEAPAGQGFGAAARACLGNGRFEAALDRGGRPVASAVTVRVRFTR